MRTHPGILMLVIWGLAVAAFMVLPFQLETRTVTMNGYLVLSLFLVTFVVGTFVASPVLPRRGRIAYDSVNVSKADALIRVVTVITVSSLLIESATTSFATLEDAFQDRNARSVGVLMGHDTGGSIFFQIGFLTYPIAYVTIVREALIQEHIRLARLALIGFAPPVLASLVMGGRGPILYAFVVLVAALLTRRILFSRNRKQQAKKSGGKRLAMSFFLVIGMLISMNYFVEVFLVRASVAGGVDAMTQIAAYNWGVSFDGPGSETLRAIVGNGNTYLIYVFIWYLVQGLVISNTVFSEFVGDPTLGIYGLDLATAVVRRIDPHLVSSKLAPLAALNVYGFLPNAFGSLYVDFKYYALIPTFAWGFACGFAYRRMARSSDVRWLLVWPFVVVGLLFSLLNTPLGFGNGLVTHLWLLTVALLIRPVTSTRSRLAAA